MFVNYFITIYLHNCNVHVLFEYYYTACIIIFIILSGDGALAFQIFRAGRARCDPRAEFFLEQSIFILSRYPLNRRRIETS